MKSLKEQAQEKQADSYADNSIDFLYGQLALEVFRQASGNPLYVAVLQEILAQFFSIEIENFRIFSTADGAMSFPYTFIDVTRLARELYTRFTSGQESLSQDEYTLATIPIIRSGDGDCPKRSIYVLFGSGAFPFNGHPFSGVEIAMHQTIKILRTVIRALQTGGVPPEILVITVGTPTNNRWGKVTPPFRVLKKW